MSAERDAFDAALKALMVAEDCVDDGQIITSYILVGTAVGGRTGAGAVHPPLRSCRWPSSRGRVGGPLPFAPPGRDPSTHDHQEHTMTDPDVEREITMSAATVAFRLSRACRVDPLLPARLPAGVLAALRDYDAMADGSEAVAS